MHTMQHTIGYSYHGYFSTRKYQQGTEDIAHCQKTLPQLQHVLSIGQGQQVYINYDDYSKAPTEHVYSTHAVYHNHVELPLFGPT